MIEVPVERVVLLSATQAALIERLSERRSEILESVVGIAWGGQYEWYLERFGELVKERCDKGHRRIVLAQLRGDRSITP